MFVNTVTDFRHLNITGDAIYGMLVHSCVASDGSGVEYRLIDQTG